jgi:hypothetical protein
MKTWLPLVLLAVLAAPAALAQERAFTEADYLKFFAPGHFASKSVYYASTGEMEVLANKPSNLFGRHFLAQTTATLDVAANYDSQSEFEFYKVKAENTEQLVWDDARQVYLFVYSLAEFEKEGSTVWESRNMDPEISPRDKGPYPLHRFYNDADRRAGRDVAAIELRYRTDVVGAWTWRCVWLAPKQEFQVRCDATHQPTGRVEDYLYRRSDLVS